MNTITERNGKSIVIPDADELAEAIHTLPKGMYSNLGLVRKSIAAKHDVDQCCPVTVQRLLVQFSESDEVPYWRVVDPEKPFAKRLVGGADRVREMLKRESQ